MQVIAINLLFDMLAMERHHKSFHFLAESYYKGYRVTYFVNLV